MDRSLAFIFPGQGSQSVGMLSDMADAYPVIKKTFDQASVVLDMELWSVVKNGPEDQLNRTDITQPALLTASVALWRVWQQCNGQVPGILSGHSLGEYSALVCAQALGFEDAVRLVNLRGQYMQSAVPAGHGAMAAILGLDDQAVRDACQRAAQDQVVAAVNFNSPGQVVIAGNSEAVDRAIDLAKQAGAKKAMRLAVSVPSHCDLMGPAAVELEVALQSIDVQVPAIPVVHNANAGVADSPSHIKQLLVQQLSQPVLWVDCIKFMMDQGTVKLIECGPGKVLSGLAKRIDRELDAGSIGDAVGLDKLLVG